jgi:acyl-CoA dehydrogenase
MEFSLTEEQQDFRKAAQGIAERFDESYWQEIDGGERFPREFWDVLAEKGVLGMAVPEAYGGLGRSWLDHIIVAEALAEFGAGMDGAGILINGPVFGASLITRHGSEEQKKKYLPGLVKGAVWAGAFTEADSGSNVSAIRTRAELDGDHYVVDGQKMFISQVPAAKHMVILARTERLEESKKTEGVSLLTTDLPDPAVTFQPMKKMGCHFMATGSVYIEGLRVPCENVVGPADKAWAALFDVLNPERFLLAAVAVGTGMLALRKAAEYASQRTVWGKQPIGAYQGVQFPLAEAAVHLAAARLTVYQAAWLYDQHSRECGLVSAQAKYAAAHASLEAADSAIQVLGGSGYMAETGLERHWRNLRVNRIAPVSDEMTLAYLAQNMLGLPRSY